jgi:Ca-activated chloride channel family protein
MNFVRKAIVTGLAALAFIAPVVAAERAIIVLDGSGSMWAQIDGEARISIARDTLSKVLSTMPAEIELGLMTYGHREKGNCADIEMLVTPASDTAGAINMAAAKINPKGMTPLSDAVRLAAEELRYTEQAATVILITDGLETCEVDPCALGGELEAQGIDFTAHVLGFGLSDDEGRQVACLAENTGGQYLSASDGAGLVDALSTAVMEVAQAPEPEPEPAPVKVEHEFNLVPKAELAEGVPYYDDLGQLVWELREVTPNGAGDRIQTEYNKDAKFNVEPGEYYLRASFGGVQVDTKVTVGEGELVEPVIILNAGVVRVRAVTSEGQQPNSNTQIRIRYGDDYDTTYGTGDFRLPAGELRLEVTHDSASYTEEFELAAGQILEKDVSLEAGLLAYKLFYAEGVEVQGSDPRVAVFPAKVSIDGSREQLDVDYASSGQMYFSPGDYIVGVTMQGANIEVPFIVAAGERNDLNVILNAGVAAFTTPGAEKITVYASAVSIDGSREDVGAHYGDSWQYAFTEGDYIAVARMPGDVLIEVPFQVTAGERVEVEISEAAAAAAGIEADKPAGKTKTK